MLPAKTAVILHAIDQNLITTDMTPPRFLTKSGGKTFNRIDIEIPTSDGKTIPARAYQPIGEGPFPMIMYYHGGAFMEGYGSIDTHDNVARSLAIQTKSVVVSVGYRVAPKYVFPTAIEDSYDALVWTAKHARQFSGDPMTMAVAGDSAGGNIATVVSAMSRDRNGPVLKAQVLYYPLTTFQDLELPTREMYDSGYYLLSRQVMHKARDSYTPYQSMWTNPYTSPLNAQDLTNLPPAFIITAEFDPLRDEGEAYAERLYEFGVPVETVRYQGTMHGFISFYEVMYKGKHGMQESTQFLKKAFADEIEPAPFAIRVVNVPKGTEKVRDQIEAYAIAGFLLSQKYLPFKLIYI
ncbi:alpha/beta hydrolase [Anaerobacillus sp. MEB173]|uniref:alpha/beta hydrolase n=1 Tax=Anaerobacillus sp. MEB173 TaxID=3383345 RepID=UPI003F91E6D2